MNDSESIARARQLVARSPDSDDVLVGRRPAPVDLLDPGLLKTALSVVVLVALVDLNGYRAPQLFDPIDLMLRLFAVAALARLVLGMVRVAMRLRGYRAASEHALVRLDDELVFLSPKGDRRWRLVDVAQIHVDPEAPGRSVEVLLLFRHPAATPFFVLPPPLAVAPAATERRLARWIGPRKEPTEPATFEPPSHRPSEVYDQVARASVAGTAAIAAGHAWLARGPYAAVLFVVVFAERMLRVPPGFRLGVVPLAALVVCVALPIVWWRLARRDAVARDGLACVATPAELLFRNRFGIHRAPWSAVTDVRVEKQTSWTVLEGVRTERKVVVERDDDAPIVLDERTMALGAHAVRAVLEAYRSGLLPGRVTPASGEESPSVPPSQGRGAGGGISGVDGTTT